MKAGDPFVSNNLFDRRVSTNAQGRRLVPVCGWAVPEAMRHQEIERLPGAPGNVRAGWCCLVNLTRGMARELASHAELS